jgi:tetratricopeptide (TPR) repeat protein
MKSVVFGVIILSNLFACREKQKEESKSKDFVIFNEGVTLNLESISEQEKGNYEKAIELNKKSIEKFKETLRIDSTHGAARSALAHSLYIDKQFAESIYWFEQANKVNGEMAANYRELGLAKINLGKIQDGKVDLDKAFAIDTSKEIREITIQDLADIGDLAFSYGDGFIQQGEQKKGSDYKRFSVGVLMLAFEYDSSKQDIAAKTAKYAEAIGDKSTAKKYKKLSGRN